MKQFKTKKINQKWNDSQAHANIFPKSFMCQKIK